MTQGYPHPCWHPANLIVFNASTTYGYFQCWFLTNYRFINFRWWDDLKHAWLDWIWDSAFQGAWVISVIQFVPLPWFWTLNKQILTSDKTLEDKIVLCDIFVENNPLIISDACRSFELERAAEIISIETNRCQNNTRTV